MQILRDNLRALAPLLLDAGAGRPDARATPAGMVVAESFCLMSHAMAIRLAVLLAVLWAIICGDVNSADEADAGSGDDVDASSSADATPPCAVAERYELLSADGSSSAGGTATDGLFVFAGLGDGDLFKVTFVPGVEPYLGTDGLPDPTDGSGTQDDLVVPGPVDIAGTQLAYATAGVALEIFGNVSGEAAEQSYYATGGSVQLDSVDGQLTFSVEDVTFEHVHIDPDTLEQTTDPSGCTTSIGAGTVTTTIQPSSARPPDSFASSRRAPRRRVNHGFALFAPGREKYSSIMRTSLCEG